MTDERQDHGRQAAPAAPVTPIDALLSPESMLGLFMLGLVIAVVVWASPMAASSGLESLGLAALLVTWVIALSLGTLHLLRRWLRRCTVGRLVLVTAAVVLAITVASGFTGWVLVGGAANGVAGLADFLLRLVVIAAGMACVGSLVAVNAARWQASRLAMARAELRHLQARVHPHFLFNALNAATAFLPARPAEAEAVLLDLADLFRVALRQEQTHGLDDELALTRRYLDIEARRLGERLRLAWTIADDLGRLEVPTFCVQVLAENAIQHGIEPTREGGTVAISARSEAGWTLIEVSNPVASREARPGRFAGQRIGLAGNRARLEAHLGPEATLTTAVAGGVHVARLRLPPQATTR
jgi:two-component system sensor histidine kinase AlgZ